MIYKARERDACQSAREMEKSTPGVKQEHLVDSGTIVLRKGSHQVAKIVWVNVHLQNTGGAKLTKRMKVNGAIARHQIRYEKTQLKLSLLFTL